MEAKATGKDLGTRKQAKLFDSYGGILQE